MGYVGSPNLGPTLSSDPESLERGPTTPNYGALSKATSASSDEGPRWWMCCGLYFW